MLTKQLKVLIDTSLANGRQLNDIREILKKQGFLESAIDELFNEYKEKEVEKKTQNISGNNSVDLGIIKMPEVKESVPVQPSVEIPKSEIPTSVSSSNSFNSNNQINIGLGDIPELQNAALNAYNNKKSKSVIPFIIAIFFILVIMGGFTYWFIYLKDGGILDSQLPINSGDDPVFEKPVEEPVDKGTIDPYTGNQFLLEE